MCMITPLACAGGILPAVARATAPTCVTSPHRGIGRRSAECTESTRGGMAMTHPYPDDQDAPGARRPDDDYARLTAWVRGTVQGVGFRWWTRSRALELGLVGLATNLPDGRVEVIAEGSRAQCEELLALLSEQPPRYPPPNAPRSYYRRPGRVDGVTYRWLPARGDLTGFQER